ncbi:MAG TPA: hypothetical protein ENN99_09125 [Chloroflexi bacterium]|nr:hypothetical protein [Chloroflexota bacterium]
MTQHVTARLHAYHDGELSDHQRRQVDTHLAQCEACRAELETLRQLTALLHQAAAAPTITSPDRFVAQVGLRLPRRPAEPAWQRVLKVGWRLTPVGLLGAWAFLQAAFLVSGILLGALYLGLGSETWAGLLPASGSGSWLAQALSLSDASLSDIGQVGAQLLRGGGPLGWGVTLNRASSVLIGLLYLSWLASWWASRQHRPGLIKTGSF